MNGTVRETKVLKAREEGTEVNVGASFVISFTLMTNYFTQLHTAR